MTSHFDAEGFFGALLGATFRTQDCANMKKFLGTYFTLNTSQTGQNGAAFDARWQAQEQKTIDAMKQDPAGAKVAPSS